MDRVAWGCCGGLLAPPPFRRGILYRKIFIVLEPVGSRNDDIIIHIVIKINIIIYIDISRSLRAGSVPVRFKVRDRTKFGSQV